MTYTPDNSITIVEAGDYELLYQVNDATAAEADTITLLVRANGTELPNSAVSDTVEEGETFDLRGATIQTLAEGDVIDLALLSAAEQAVTLPDGLTASLIVKKLN